MAFPNAQTTDKSAMIIPEVMAQMIAARLPKAITFSPLATVDNNFDDQASWQRGRNL